MTKVETLAAEVGLHVSTWSPGDGVTRYRFHREASDYNAGREVKTVLGRRDALLWLDGVREGQHNPRTNNPDAEYQLDRNLSGWYSNPYET